MKGTLEITDTEILSNPQCVKDEVICEGRVECDQKNRPIHFTGGFAIVFPFIVKDKKWAFKCWHTKVDNIEKRMELISNFLESQKLPYFCQFTFKSEGLLTRKGELIPTTRMQWIEGEKINDYICAKKEDTSALHVLADKFLIMCQELHKANIAHGDLQHGNIIVGADQKLYLIDYDSVFTPNMENEKDVICGLPGYQHPNRSMNEYANAKLDYFSELIIYISILAIAENPELVQRYNVENSDHLLFTKDDFKNLGESEIYKDIHTLSNKLRQLIDILAFYLSKDSIDDFGSFDYMLAISQKHLHYGEKQHCIHCGAFAIANERNIFCMNCGKPLLDYNI